MNKSIEKDVKDVFTKNQDSFMSKEKSKDIEIYVVLECMYVYTLGERVSEIKKIFKSENDAEKYVKELQKSRDESGNDTFKKSLDWRVQRRSLF